MSNLTDEQVSGLPQLPEPLEIDWPELHSQGLGCGVEDRNITNRYEAAEYGWQHGVDQAIERVPEDIFTTDQMREYARTALESVSNALYSHLMGGTFDIGEAYLNLKCVGSCPSKDDFLAALLALAAEKEPT
ncbi:hypothetical protein SAMN05216466_107136 [Paraburkholderia phenazinium]|uniref:Uncharacterized protein n=1 Tax=Paraburkholderia phenazinium TaxID=60549 RepID=A0A1G7ZQQ8_9BURK|nr:hypothetical protein [Paraburkholderia phenazinium]SDH11043.1 hypothetical protein SAMN05216466_107136 [Paraburkholderia phenazinium]